VEYKIFNSPLAASPPPQRFGASLLIMKKYKIIVKDKKTGATMQDEELTKKCDSCGFDIIGESHDVVNENFEVQEGLFMCSDCKYHD